MSIGGGPYRQNAVDYEERLLQVLQDTIEKLEGIPPEEWAVVSSNPKAPEVRYVGHNGVRGFWIEVRPDLVTSVPDGSVVRVSIPDSSCRQRLERLCKHIVLVQKLQNAEAIHNVLLKHLASSGKEDT